VESAKTKGFLGLLSSLKVEGSTLLVAESGDKNLALASRNVQDFEIANPISLNTYQLLRYKNVLFTRSAMELLDQRLTTEETEISGKSE